MKALLVVESRDGTALESAYELQGFADAIHCERIMLLVGSAADIPNLEGRLYLADANRYGEYDPDAHKALVLEAVRREAPDYVVFMHSAYGWDLAPRVGMALGAGQVSEIVAVSDDGFEVPCCNGKMRRSVRPLTSTAVLTIQAGAFPFLGVGNGTPAVEALEVTPRPPRLVELVGHEAAGGREVALAEADVVVSAGRGVGRQENLPLVAALARALGGELGASRPVVDAGWVEHGRQVGSTGQTVTPKLYVACGISGSVQHLAGMKDSQFIVAINKDRDAPIREVADVFVVADIAQLLPVLTARLGERCGRPATPP